MRRWIANDDDNVMQGGWNLKIYCEPEKENIAAGRSKRDLEIMFQNVLGQSRNDNWSLVNHLIHRASNYKANDHMGRVLFLRHPWL